MKITCSTIGNEKIFPVIKSLVSIFNENYNKNEYTYCLNLLGEYRNTIKNISDIKDNKIKIEVLILLKNKYLKQLNQAKLSRNVYSHMCNLVCGIVNFEIKKYDNK